MKDDQVNLEKCEAFVMSLEEAYRDPDHVNTAERALTKRCLGNQDFVMYYAEFQRLIADLNWTDAAKCIALHRSLSEEHKDILSTQDLPKEWSSYITLVKKCNMQYHICKAESHRCSGQNKSTSTLDPCNVSPVPAQPTPHPTSSSSSHFGPIPIDLLAARHCLSHEECQKRIDEGHCLYCGGFNHMA
jgi:hypothetical protein